MPFQKGHKINLGKKINPPEKRNCLVCGTEFKDYLSNNRKYCSTQCLGYANSKRMLGGSTVKGKHWKQTKETIDKKRGEKSWNWQGGITLLYNRIYNSFEYRQWRSDVYKRDWFECQECEAKKNLRPHHIKSVKEIIAEYNIKIFEDALDCAELWDINNGQTLCQRCHNKIHR
jgi:hypothetical protein